MVDMQPEKRDESKEFENDVAKIIHSKDIESKPSAIKSLLERLKNFYIELNLQDQLSSLEKILLSEEEEAEQKFKEFIRDCNEKLIEMEETYARDEYELFQERNAQEMEQRAKEEAYKAPPPSTDEDDNEIKTLADYKKVQEAFLERNKDGFSNSLENRKDISAMRDFVNKKLKSSNAIFGSDNTLSEQKQLLARIKENEEKINNMLNSQNFEEKLENLSKNILGLQEKMSSESNPQEKERLQREIEFSQSQVEQLSIYIPPKDFMINDNMLSSQSLLERLQQEIPKTSPDETNEEYLKRVNAMDATALSSDAQSTLDLYQQSLTDEQVNNAQTENKANDDLIPEPESEPEPIPESEPEPTPESEPEPTPESEPEPTPESEPEPSQKDENKEVQISTLDVPVSPFKDSSIRSAMASPNLISPNEQSSTQSPKSFDSSNKPDEESQSSSSNQQKK